MTDDERVDPRDVAALAAVHDRSSMARVLESSHGQIETALAVDLPAPPPGPFDEAVVAGMGGSALPVEVLVDALGEELRAPLTTCRTYRLPPAAGRRRLVIGCSFSGNTEETLAAFRQAIDGGEAVVAVSRGGRLESEARAAGAPFVRIPSDDEPDGFQPRSATGYIVTLLARVLHAAGLAADPAGTLGSVAGFLGRLDPRAEAVATARWIGDRIPIVYADERHAESLARVVKIKFNEHAKRPAFWNALPEANHNETIGLSTAHGRYALVYLHDPDGPPEILERFDAMQRVFGERGLGHVGFRRWDLPGETNAERLFAGLVWGDWCAWALALLDGRDPTPVELVEAFKAELVRARGR